ncbi:toxin-antitoxin system YwqK family antitoxin [Streptomyces sp. NPDC021212]|uniref:toxin-antitoxin system YwqK family antitoxin n=1 Tax=Streptomyces sp. NPDC021212 TaxID=3365118 RepID=UPI00378A8B0A
MAQEPEPTAATRVVRDDDLDSYPQDGPVHYQGELFTGDGEDRAFDGTLNLRTSYLDGRQHGPDREWHPDGTLKTEGFFQHGIPVGVHRAWRPDGTMSQEVEFSDSGMILRRDSHP